MSRKLLCRLAPEEMKAICVLLLPLLLAVPASAQSSDARELIGELFGGVPLHAREYDVYRYLQSHQSLFVDVVPGNPTSATMISNQHLHYTDRHRRNPSSIGVWFFFENGVVAQRRLNISLESTTANKDRLMNLMRLVTGCQRNGEVNWSESTPPSEAVYYYSSCARGVRPFANLSFQNPGNPIAGWVTLAVLDNQIRSGR